MSFDIRFGNERTTEGCTFLDVRFSAPSYQAATGIVINGQAQLITCSGDDTAFIYGSDLLGWCVVLGKRITPDQLDGFEIPGVSIDTREDGGVSAHDFATLEDAKRFVVHVYEAFYEAFYLGFVAYTLDDAPASEPAYSLHTARIGQAGGAGAHDLVTVLADGEYRPGRGNASLALEGQDGRPGCCTVFIPAGVPLDDALAQDVADHLFATARTGTRHYAFATREAALDFLRRIYGIDDPAPVSSRSVPAPLARDVALPLLPRPALGATERAAFFDAAPIPASPGFSPGVNTPPTALPPAANRHESPIREGRSPTTEGRQCLIHPHPRNTP
ncbi:hypothetical protein LG302_01570 [Halomonas organivorans]